jgi:hypothetical protein
MELGELTDWECARGEEGELEKACDGEFAVVGEWMELRKGKEEASVDTGGTGKEGAKVAARPKEEDSGSGRLLVLLLLGDPASGLCLMFLNTLR